MDESMRIAVVAATNGTCNRRKIGAALYNDVGDILGEGWNGVDGECNCPGRDVPAGAGNAACYGSHAEIRALIAAMNAGHKSEQIYSCYSTKAPCAFCVGVLLLTGCQRIVFRTASNETLNEEMWTASGREWVHQPEE